MKRKIRNDKLRRWRARRTRTARSVERARHPVVTVFRSSKHIYAQLVDPMTGQTLGSVSTRSQDAAAEGNKVDAARRVGAALAELAREKQIGKAVFNRNGFLYHGRVKALAEGAREAGLEL
jgi:large subunit ribosomal protein L18